MAQGALQQNQHLAMKAVMVTADWPRAIFTRPLPCSCSHLLCFSSTRSHCFTHIVAFISFSLLFPFALSRMRYFTPYCISSVSLDSCFPSFRFSLHVTVPEVQVGPSILLLPLGAPHTLKHTHIHTYLFPTLSFPGREVTFLRQDIKQTEPLYHKTYLKQKLKLFLMNMLKCPPTALLPLPPFPSPSPASSYSLSTHFLSASQFLSFLHPYSYSFPISPLLPFQRRLNLSPSLHV